MTKVYISPNATGPTQAVSIDTDKCICCNSCANICRTQTIMPHPVKGQPPVLVYPDECWYCGCCVEVCPTGALSMNLPINQRILFRRRETGEVFRIGQKNPPPKSYFRPPAGWMGPGGTHEEGAYGETWKLLLALDRKPVAIVVYKDTIGQIINSLGYNPTEEDGGKIAGILRKIGFTKVYLADSKQKDLIQDLHNSCPEIKIIAVTDSTEGMNDYDILLMPADVARMWKRACVSNYTAAAVWENTEPEKFD